MPSNHLILCCPLLLLPSIFPSIRVFSNESVLRIRWPKYWSFSFSISPSNEYSGLISFRMDWLDLLAVQGTLKSPDHLTCLLRNLYAGQEATVRTGHGTTDWFQIGKEYINAIYCHPAYLTSMQSTSWEMLGWMKHKLESRLPGEISITSDMQMTESKELKRPLMKVKEESEKVGLKVNIHKTKIMASGPITSWQIDRETVGTVTDFIFLGSKNHCRWWLQP